MEQIHFDEGVLGKDEVLGQGLGDGESRKSNAFVHAKQQLHTQSNACVPPKGEDADEARHNGWPQEVLHRRGAVRVSIKHLGRKREDHHQL